MKIRIVSLLLTAVIFAGMVCMAVPSAHAQTGDATGATTEAATEASTEATTEAATEQSTEPVTEPLAEALCGVIIFTRCMPWQMTHLS